MTKKHTFLPCFLLVLVMILSTACSGSGEELKKPANVDTSSSETSSETPDIESEEESIAAEEPQEKPAEESEEDSSTTEVSLTETVVYDENDVKVTATGYTEGFMGPEIQFVIENNSDQTLLITTSMVSVNGFMTPYTSLYAEVTAGKKSNESMTFLTTELEQYGIETIADAAFYVEVSDAETWETLHTSELITLSTTAAGLEQPVDDSGDVLYDENGIRILCKGLKQDLIWDGTLVFFVENTSGNPITVYAENVSVNGYMQDASFWVDLRDNTRIIDGLSLLDLSDLSIESIDDVENIEFNLRIIDPDTWEDIVVTDVISLSFE